MEHSFTPVIYDVLSKHFSGVGSDVFLQSPLLQYINIKTRSVSKGSKARYSFGNLYVIYVLVEDYINNGFVQSCNYSQYKGAKFTELLRRARELPFGAKIQNHAFNNRLNDEFKKYFNTCEFQPVVRDLMLQRYWLCENLLKVKVGSKIFNVAKAVVDIIDAYIHAKSDSFRKFINICKNMQSVPKQNETAIVEYIKSLLEPNVDARVFEIVSYAILKQYYSNIIVYWGWSLEKIEGETLALFKTGRTNANDGGIDFVMKPLGRFFQVTETLDLKKYFLDIDKVQRYPVTFVVKTNLSEENVRNEIERNARKIYSIDAIVKKYMACIEEIINIPLLIERLHEIVANKHVFGVFNDIILQSEMEFNFNIEK